MRYVWGAVISAYIVPIHRQHHHPLNTAALQVLLDGLAASSAYNLGISWVGQSSFGDLTPLAAGGVFILAGYFAGELFVLCWVVLTCTVTHTPFFATTMVVSSSNTAGFVFDAFTFVAIAYAVVMFNLDATSFMQAVKEIANTSSSGMGYPTVEL